MADAIVMRDVGLQAPDGKRILEGIDLAVAEGDVLQIVGPSGSGKTSLIRLINRLDEASFGSVEVLGRPVKDWPPDRLRRRVGMVFQEPTLLGLSVRQNLRLPLDLHGTDGDDVEQRIERVLELAGVDPDLLDRDENRLSVGQKQLVSLARSLMTEPGILLLDEPTSGLDRRTAESLLDRLNALNEESGRTIVIVTHRLGEVPRLGGRMAVMIDGSVGTLEAAGELLEDPPDGPVRDFLLGGNES